MGMAPMLSAVSHVFSGQGGAGSTISESEDQQDRQMPDNVREETSLSKSNVKSPKKGNGTIKPLFTHHSEWTWRDEIEIEVQSKNDKNFTGTKDLGFYHSY